MSKARMLKQAAGRLTTARVLPLVIFSIGEWKADAAEVERRINANSWALGTLIVRSSAVGEDSVGDSSAGRYTSVANVQGPEELRTAIETVLKSYGELVRGHYEIFVQPMLENAVASGAATSLDPSGGGHYRIITWTDGPATDVVTAGRPGSLRNWRGVDAAPGWNEHSVVGPVLSCIREIECAFDFETFEIEFGIDSAGNLVLFQIRHLSGGLVVPNDVFSRAVARSVSEATAAQERDARILGEGVLLGGMTDWNPAEMIGLRPLPLARSLYRRLVTDEAWAQRRAEYGYRDLRGIPLMIDLTGHALVDVRASLTSFVPARLPNDIAARLVSAYSERLRHNPSLHDKVEFEVAITCLSFDAVDRLQSYVGHCLEKEDVAQVEAALRELTDHMARETLVADEMRVVAQLAQFKGNAARLPPVQRALHLLNATATWGTVPFAGLARCSFVATHMLRSAVAAGMIERDNVDRFFAGLSLPSTSLRHDLATLPREKFLSLHGHLRPGTYDIRSPRYDEEPDLYFLGLKEHIPLKPGSTADMPAHARPALERGFHSLAFNWEASAFISFARAAIEGREWSKYEFSRCISDALYALTEWGRSIGLDREDLAYLTCEDIEKASALTDREARAFLRDRIAAAAGEIGMTQQVSLPILLRSPSECLAFESIPDQPNYVTQGRAIARVANIDIGEDPSGAVAAVRSADPGYDWIFARGIVGLITAFGGPNSHMAIRALENGIPAAIGCGAAEFARLADFRFVELDAGAGFVRGIA